MSNWKIYIKYVLFWLVFGFIGMALYAVITKYLESRKNKNLK